MNKFGLKSWFVAVAFCAGASLAVERADAATVNVYNDTDVTAPSTAGTAGGLRGTITCAGDCSVLRYDPSSYSFGAIGELFDGPSSSGDANEVAWVNSVVGSSFGVSDIIDYTNTTDANNENSFSIAANLVVLKIGRNPDYTIIRNLGAGPLTFSYVKAAGAQGSLSHFFGLDPSGGVNGEIPVPASMPLLLTALGAGVLLHRKRRKSA